MKARGGVGGGGFDPVPVGVHRAVCVAVVDLGMQPAYRAEYKPAYKVLLTFELPDELTDNGEPRLISETLTASMSTKANLRKLIESWFGKGFPSDEAAGDFDLRNLLGRPAFLNVTHTQKGEKTYAKVTSVIPLPKNAEKPIPSGEPLYYSEAGDQPLEERSLVYSKLPEWVRKKIDGQIRATPEPLSVPAGAASTDGAFDGDDIPF